MSKEIELNAENFEATVMESDKVTIVDFWAPWCGYCVRMMPTFEKLADEMTSDNLQFAKVNTDEEQALAQAFQIEVLPTFCIVKDKKIIDKKIGFVPEAELKEAIEKAL